MKIENRTPHVVVLLLDNGVKQILEPMPPAVRLTFDPGDVEDPSAGDTCAGIPIHRAASVRGLTGLPPPREGVLVLVSQLAALGVNFHHPERTDVVHPVMGRRNGPDRDQFGGMIRALVRAV